MRLVPVACRPAELKQMVGVHLPLLHAQPPAKQRMELEPARFVGARAEKAPPYAQIAQDELGVGAPGQRIAQVGAHRIGQRYLYHELRQIFGQRIQHAAAEETVEHLAERALVHRCRTVDRPADKRIGIRANTERPAVRNTPQISRKRL